MKAQKVYTVPVKARTLQRVLDAHAIPSRRLERKVANLLAQRPVLFTVAELATLLMVTRGVRSSLVAGLVAVAALVGG